MHSWLVRWPTWPSEDGRGVKWRVPFHALPSTVQSSASHTKGRFFSIPQALLVLRLRLSHVNGLTNSFTTYSHRTCFVVCNVSSIETDE